MNDNEYLGSVCLIGQNFVVEGYQFCDGRFLDPGDHAALYSVLKTNFGGDGRASFALPDLRGRVAVGVGTGEEPSLSPRSLGEKGGIEAFEIQIREQNLPVHNHTAGFLPEKLQGLVHSTADTSGSEIHGTLSCNNTPGSGYASPVDAYPGRSSNAAAGTWGSVLDNVMAPDLIDGGSIRRLEIQTSFGSSEVPVAFAEAGGGIPLACNTCSPTLAVNYAIRTNGEYAPRS